MMMMIIFSNISVAQISIYDQTRFTITYRNPKIHLVKIFNVYRNNERIGYKILKITFATSMSSPSHSVETTGADPGIF